VGAARGRALSRQLSLKPIVRSLTVTARAVAAGVPPVRRLQPLEPREELMRCEEIMKTQIECVGATDTVQFAARKMRDNGVGFLPVCGPHSQVLGTITDRDLAIRACAEDRPASQTAVGDVMTKEVVSCSPTDDIDRARTLMSKHFKSRMLCIDETNKLVGVISLSDLIQVELDRGARTLRDVSAREVH